LISLIASCSDLVVDLAQQQIFHQRFLYMQAILASATAPRFNQRLDWRCLPV
jgi:hypothetical protein